MADDGWVYIQINKGMYGLPQAGILANNLLTKRLAAKGYYQCQYTPGLWKHVHRDIAFCLVVDDFGVKTTKMEHMLHLRQALEEHYTVSVDWTGTLYCGITLKWDYTSTPRTVDINMPGYADKTCLRFNHPTPARPQHSPYKSTPIQYGAKVQRVAQDTTPPLNKDEIKRVQEIVGTLLYYGRAVDPTLLAALSTLHWCQSNLSTCSNW